MKWAEHIQSCYFSWKMSVNFLKYSEAAPLYKTQTRWPWRKAEGNLLHADENIFNYVRRSWWQADQQE